MTNLKKIDEKLLDIIDNIESKTGWHESNICDDLMYTLSRLDIGHNRVVRYWMANELYILLRHGSEQLDKHRNDNNWWG
jgi:hypothetical protein